MATQATWYGRYGAVAENTTAVMPDAREERADIYRLRALPNEDVYFYRKAIDNSRLIRQANPQASKRCLRMIATTCALTLLLLVMLWPKAYGVLAGYQIESLKAQQQKLAVEHRSLEIEEARLLSPERIEEMAKTQEFIDPAPGQVVYLNPSADGSLAMNVRSK
ncbi:MAG TPA: hypothetical protein VLE22_23990 [Bryobacteraceae bacterium]|nr:hypothetical protein [Bryobacteraceae bacterium]